jgi:hypothetical protein
MRRRAPASAGSSCATDSPAMVDLPQEPPVRDHHPRELTGRSSYPRRGSSWPPATPARQVSRPGRAADVMESPGDRLMPVLSIQRRSANCSLTRDRRENDQRAMGVITDAEPSALSRSRGGPACPGRCGGRVAPVTAGTSPTRADRRHRPRAAAGPSCRPSCPCRTPDCASRMSRPPGRRPRPPRRYWCGDPQRSVSYR